MLKSCLNAVFLIFTPLAALADTPQFADYPVTARNQTTPPPSNKDKNLKGLSSELQEALKTQKINYAGHYIVYTKSCGQNCISVFIADTLTGENIITAFREYYIHDKQNIPFEIKHQPNSNLLILSGSQKHIWEYPTETYWTVNKGKLHRLTGYFDFHKIEHNKTTFQKYCQDLNIGKRFNSSSDFLCVYPHKTIRDIYQKLLNSSEDKRFLSYPLPKIGKKKSYALKNDGDSTDIFYEWLSHDSLQITINQQSVGQTTYHITQAHNKVKVQIHTEQNNDRKVTIKISP